MSHPINWKLMTDETVTNLSRLIQAATENPPGDELPAIMIIKDILEKAGIPPESITILESIPKRVNLVVRIKGDGSKRPLLLSGHVDVVPADRDQWSHDPFGGEVFNGEVWGRGALDMKGFLAMYLEIFLSLYRQKIPLKRDVILAAIADEEHGFTHGSKFLVEQHRGLIDAEYGFTEAGALTVFLGRTKLYPIQVAEKSFCQLRARVHGKVGHGSIPPRDNAIYRIAQVIARINTINHLPAHFTPTTQEMADAAALQLRFPFNVVVRMLKSPYVMDIVLRSLKGYSRDTIAALVTNTVFLNRLQAGNEMTPTPSMAEVDLICGLVPGQTPDQVKSEVQQVVGTGVEIEIIRSITGAEFSTGTPLYKLLDQRTRQMDPGGLVIPMLMPGITDACQYQKAGIIVYGFTPGVLPPDITILQLAHGIDERMPISFIETGLPVLWDVVTEFCGKEG